MAKKKKMQKMENLGSAVIMDENMVSQYKKDSKEYALEVNKVRQIPDVRDGLKTVVRHIIITMLFDLPVTKKKFVKSAQIVGAVMGKYHPHGDSSIYDAFKPITNDFESNLTLLLGHGNYGSALGDGAAAYRYTETMLPQVTLDLLEDFGISKNVTLWIDNYDGSSKKPEVLPMKIPLLLVNGSFGIGYGMRCIVPQHNLVEVINETIKVIKNPRHKVFLIPDTPMGSDIVETDFKRICNTGKGTITVRAKIDIETLPNGATALVVKSLPERVYMDKIIETINELRSKSNMFKQIVDMNNDSDNKVGYERIRYVFELKKNADPQFVLDMLYSKTALTSTIAANMIVLTKDLKNLRLSYTNYIKLFLDNRKAEKFSACANKLQELRTAYHEVSAYLEILEDGRAFKILDELRKMNATEAEIIDTLMNTLDITPLQAKYIINSPNKSQFKDNIEKLKKSTQALKESIDYYTEMVLSEQKIEESIIQELEYIRDTYGRPRRSRVIPADSINRIPKGDFRIVITEDNLVRKVAPDSNISLSNAKFIVDTCNTEDIILFDSIGKMYLLPVHVLPIDNGKGVELFKYIKSMSEIIAAFHKPLIKKLSNLVQENYYCVITTRNGNIKRILLTDVLNSNPSGYFYTRFSDADDLVVNVSIVNANDDVVVFSKTSALRLKCEDIPLQKRSSKGMRSFPTGVIVDGATSVNNRDTEYLVAITDKGYVNKFKAVALQTSIRNKEGSSIIKLTRGDSVKDIVAVSNKDNIILRTSSKGDILVPINSIEDSSTMSKGVKLLNRNHGTLVSVKGGHN